MQQIERRQVLLLMIPEKRNRQRKERQETPKFVIVDEPEKDVLSVAVSLRRRWICGEKATSTFRSTTSAMVTSARKPAAPGTAPNYKSSKGKSIAAVNQVNSDASGSETASKPNQVRMWGSLISYLLMISRLKTYVFLLVCICTNMWHLEVVQG